MPHRNSGIDKSINNSLDEGYGTISIRVVVLAKSMASVVAPSSETNEIADADPDELLPDTDKRPTSTYLEEPKRGKQVCVFLINGQRQHAWDNQFMVRDLGLKYLRNRMLVIVDCDGLHPEALAELMQGSRHQFLEGRVYSALESRVFATLKGDPDLRRLEEEVEDEIADLEAGDEAVKSALDQLIESHHSAGAREHHGQLEPGDRTRQDGTGGRLEQSQTVVVDSDVGERASDPVLQLRPELATLRLKPNQLRSYTISSRPADAWPNVTSLGVTFDPPIPELRCVRNSLTTGVDLELTFVPAADFDEDEHPIETVMRASASITGHLETRMLERRVVITPSKPGPTPNPPKPLLADPTFIKVTSRQPIKIVLGGPDVHVKLRWDGKDDLSAGDPAPWQFRVSCDSPSVEPTMFLTRPSGGRFELLIQPVSGLRQGEQLKFDIEATGNGKTLSTAFLADIVESISARKIALKSSGGGQRRPPYDLKYLFRKDWANHELQSFGVPWSSAEPGSFEEPNSNSPLTIFVNNDTEMLTTWRDSMLAKRLAETTIKQRINRYTAHVAFHLYQMFLNQKALEKNLSPDAEALTESGMRDEIHRVANTLVKVMEVAT